MTNWTAVDRLTIHMYLRKMTKIYFYMCTSETETSHVSALAKFEAMRDYNRTLFSERRYFVQNIISGRRHSVQNTVCRKTPFFTEHSFQENAILYRTSFSGRRHFVQNIVFRKTSFCVQNIVFRKTPFCTEHEKFKQFKILHLILDSF